MYDIVVRKPRANLYYTHPGGWRGENAAGRSARVRQEQLQRKLPVQQVCGVKGKQSLFLL